MKLVFSFSFSPVIPSALWKHPQEYEWQVKKFRDIFKTQYYFQNKINWLIREKILYLIHSKENSKAGLGMKRRWYHPRKSKKKKAWAGHKKPVLK